MSNGGENITPLPYRPDIDGLRAMAVGGVILYHLFGSQVPGGFLGVDVFFVISGYLITQLIRRSEKGFSVWVFWFRRVRRLFPALATVLAVSCLAGWFLLPPEAWRNLGLHTIGSLFLCGNLAIWKTVGGYWGASAETTPLLHTWSLGVEEQFYLLYPLLLGALHWDRNRLRITLVLVTLGGFGFFVWGMLNHSAGTFYLLPTRAWELLAGCATAVCADRVSFRRGTADVFTALGLLIVAGIFFARPRWFPMLALPSLISVFGSILVLICGNARGNLSRILLGNSLAAYCGRLSYSLYLWHWPVFVYAGWLGIAAHAPGPLLLCASLTIASYHGIELPCRRVQEKRRFLIACGSAFLLLTVLALSIVTGTLESRLSSLPLLDNSLHAGANYEAGGKIQKGGIIRRYGVEHPEIVVLGSSHARMHSVALDGIAKDLGKTIAFLGVSDGGILDPGKKNLRKHRLEWIRRWNPQLVIMAGRWTQEEQRSRDSKEFSAALHFTCKEILGCVRKPFNTTSHRWRPR